MRDNMRGPLIHSQYSGRLTFRRAGRPERQMTLHVADWMKKSVPRWTLRPVAQVMLTIDTDHRDVSDIIWNIIDPITATPTYYES